MPVEIVDIRPWYSVTYRIRKNVYQTDPTNNAVYNRLLAQQSLFFGGLFADDGVEDSSPYILDMVKISNLLSDYSAASDLRTFLPVGFSGFSGGIPNVNLSSYCTLTAFQRLLTDPSGSTSRFPQSRTAQNAGMSIEYILERYASGTALPVQTRNMMSDSKRGLSLDDMKKVRTIENEMDAESYIRDVNARKAADDAAKAADTSPNSDN